METEKKNNYTYCPNPQGSWSVWQINPSCMIDTYLTRSGAIRLCKELNAKEGIQDISESIKKVAESLSSFMDGGHLPDNISKLTTNASILRVLAKRLMDIRNIAKSITE